VGGCSAISCGAVGVQDVGKRDGTFQVIEVGPIENGNNRPVADQAHVPFVRWNWLPAARAESAVTWVRHPMPCGPGNVQRA
jgi:hypothetical protein